MWRTSLQRIPSLALIGNFQERLKRVGLSHIKRKILMYFF